MPKKFVFFLALLFLVGPTVVEAWPFRVALQSDTGKYVSADQTYGNILFANRTIVGPWETFLFIDLGSNHIALRAGTGKYVKADHSFYDVLLATGADRGPSETFTLVDLGNNRIALKSDQGKYVSADQYNGDVLIANRTAIGAWEIFTVVGLSMGDTINTLDFFVSDHADIGLTGTHPLGQTVISNKSYYVKGGFPPTNDGNTFEFHTWDSAFIYLKEDHSDASSPYSLANAPWMKRTMQVGDTIGVETTIQYYNSACVPTTSFSTHHLMSLSAHIPSFNLGGDLGITDVIQLDYMYGCNFDPAPYNCGCGSG